MGLCVRLGAGCLPLYTVGRAAGATPKPPTSLQHSTPKAVAKINQEFFFIFAEDILVVQNYKDSGQKGSNLSQCQGSCIMYIRCGIVKSLEGEVKKSKF